MSNIIQLPPLEEPKVEPIPQFTEAKPALVYCQKCGEPVPLMDPIGAKAAKVVNPEQPNKVMLGRIDLIFRCPSCRGKIILLQQHVKTFEIAEEQVVKTLEVIKEVQNANKHKPAAN